MGIYQSFLGKADFRKMPVVAAITPAEQQRISVLPALNAHVMIADNDNVITYMNPSVEKMLRAAEPDIRERLPHFSVDTLIGANMDVFHKHPQHQKELVAGITEPFTASIRLGVCHFTLIATPLFTDGERNGTVVEWQDNTQVVNAREKEREMKALEEARTRQLAIIKSALDNVTSNVMLADPSGKIIYANPAVLSLLKVAESDIREALPDFDVDQIVGSNMSRFHRNPAHQEAMMARMQETFKARIKVGVRHFTLIASPVRSDEGDRLGTVVEWQDVTSELKMESDLENAIEAVVHGDLNVKIDHGSYSAFQAKIAQGINRIVDVFKHVLVDTGESLNAMANGDLCRKITNDYEGSYDALKKDINDTIDKLREVVTDIEYSTSMVKSSAQEISHGNLNLSERTEEQAASLEQTSATMSEISNNVQQNSENANIAYTLARKARDNAENGGKVVNDAIHAMDAINDASRKIEEIIEVIDEIAFQTNLLALNAAVEAARAGDQGRGFAVVANEVRNLASRSATAAKEIKSLIADSSTKVKQGSTLVNNSGQTLAEIIQAVTKVNDIISEITVSSEEQAGSIREINKAVQQMDDMTQQNAALVEEAAAASESLSGQADVLNEKMHFFSLH